MSFRHGMEHAGGLGCEHGKGHPRGHQATTGQRPRQATISHHLKVLRDAGLIGSEKHNQWVYYFIRPECLATVRVALDHLG